MTRQDLNVGLASILTTLAEEPMGVCGMAGAAPSGILYAAMMSADAQLWTLDAYQTLLSVLVKGALVTVRGDIVTITQKGRDIAAKCEAFARV